MTDDLDTPEKKRRAKKAKDDKARRQGKRPKTSVIIDTASARIPSPAPAAQILAFKEPIIGTRPKKKKVSSAPTAGSSRKAAKGSQGPTNEKKQARVKITGVHHPVPTKRVGQARGQHPRLAIVAATAEDQMVAEGAPAADGEDDEGEGEGEGEGARVEPDGAPLGLAQARTTMQRNQRRQQAWADSVPLYAFLVLVREGQSKPPLCQHPVDPAARFSHYVQWALPSSCPFCDTVLCGGDAARGGGEGGGQHHWVAQPPGRERPITFCGVTGSAVVDHPTYSCSRCRQEMRGAPTCSAHRRVVLRCSVHRRVLLRCSAHWRGTHVVCCVHVHPARAACVEMPEKWQFKYVELLDKQHELQLAVGAAASQGSNRLPSAQARLGSQLTEVSKQVVAIEKQHGQKFSFGSNTYAVYAKQRVVYQLQQLHNKVEQGIADYKANKAALVRRTQTAGRHEPVKLGAAMARARARLVNLLQELKQLHGSKVDHPYKQSSDPGASRPAAYDAALLDLDRLLAMSSDGLDGQMVPWEAKVVSVSAREDSVQRYLRAKEELVIIKRETQDMVEFYEYYIAQYTQYDADKRGHIAVLGEDGADSLLLARAYVHKVVSAEKRPYSDGALKAIAIDYLQGCCKAAARKLACMGGRLSDARKLLRKLGAPSLSVAGPSMSESESEAVSDMEGDE